MKCLARLAFVYHVPFWTEGGCIVTSHGAIGKYVDTLASSFSEIIIACPLPSSRETIGYALKSKNITIHTIPSYNNVLSFWLKFPLFFASSFKAIVDWDILNIRIPSHASLPLYLLSLLFRKPVFLVLVGEGSTVRNFTKYSRFKQIVAELEAAVHDRLMRAMVRQCLTFANGKDLYKRFSLLAPNVREFRSSTINECDIIDMREILSRQSKRITILTVAVIAPHKGTSLVPETISRLRQYCLDVSWLFVGEIEGNAGKMEFDKTVKKLIEYGVKDQVEFLGKLSWEQTFSLYKQCDLFVLPTLAEGVPRVLLEAQASGVPVISTEVGGIPDAIRDGYDGILVAPGDTSALADAIARVLTDSRLLDSLRRNGIETARSKTLENQTLLMLQKVSKFYPTLSLQK